MVMMHISQHKVTLLKTFAPLVFLHFCKTLAGLFGISGWRRKRNIRRKLKRAAAAEGLHRNRDQISWEFWIRWWRCFLSDFCRQRTDASSRGINYFQLWFYLFLYAVGRAYFVYQNISSLNSMKEVYWEGLSCNGWNLCILYSLY